MNKDTRTRKWLITINNPKEKGLDHTTIKERLNTIESLIYWCMADEIGEEGTYHTHLYIYAENPLRFSAIKKRFEGGHFEMARGTSQQNRDYVFKKGKWIKDKKAETNLSETQEESGDCPVEAQGYRSDIHDLYALIKEGLSDYELIELNPAYMDRLDRIRKVRQMILSEKYRNTYRKMKVEYIFGDTGAGKTRGAYERFGEDLYRVTDYEHPFDGYMAQPILVFDEFRSALIRIQDMLNYLDGYPLELPARYGNKVACYTQVLILSNLPLEQQYKNIQREYPEVWEAFFRRIHLIREYKNGEILEYEYHEYFNKYWFRFADNLKRRED